MVAATVEELSDRQMKGDVEGVAFKLSLGGGKERKG